MKKNLLLIFLTLFSFSAIHAEIEWTLSDDGTLTISGTDMPDYRFVYDKNVGQTTAPWYSERKKIKKIVIEDGVTSIGDNAFANCSSLTSVTIPNTVESIGVNAFEKCSGLTSITIPDSVESIEMGAFANCSSLTSIIIPNTVESIGICAFQYCESLTSIIIPDSVESIGDNAFDGSKGLISITIPNSVTSIGYCAFARCSGLISISFEGSMPPEFGEGVFEGINKSIPVYVPVNSLETYKKALGYYFEETSIQALQR